MSSILLNTPNLSFSTALQEEQVVGHDYDHEKWLYVPCYDTDYRYILGTKGQHPLICIGVNPSTARPDSPDPTLRQVQSIAQANGYDSFLMVNLCAQRATSSEDLRVEPDIALHRENLHAIEWTLEQVGENPTVWAAWGTAIDSRGYLTDYMREIVALCQRYNVQWLVADTQSKAKGHPHHPLYLKKNTKLKPMIDMQSYINNF